MIKYLIIIFCLLFVSQENIVSSKEQKKIEKNPKSPRFLKTVRSVGYMLVPD